MGIPTKAALFEVWSEGNPNAQVAEDGKATNVLPGGKSGGKATMSKEQVEQAHYYSRLNLTISEVTGDAKSDKLVTAQWRIAMKYAADSKTDSIAVNRAKETLTNSEARVNHNASIQAAGSSDG